MTFNTNIIAAIDLMGSIAMEPRVKAQGYITLMRAMDHLMIQVECEEESDIERARR